MGEDLRFELGRFERCRLNSAGEATQDEPGRELVGSGRSRAAKAVNSARAAVRSGARAAPRGAGRGR